MDRPELSPQQILIAIAAIRDYGGDAATLEEAELLQGYTPLPAHIHIFDPDRILLVGGRGLGKTELFRMLSLPDGAALVAAALGVEPPRAAPARFVTTFSPYRSVSTDGANAPTADEIESLLGGGDEHELRRRARLLWLAQSLMALARPQAGSRDASWPAAVTELFTEVVQHSVGLRALLDWVAEAPERPYQVLDALEKTGQFCIFTFDGLEQVSIAPNHRDALIGGLLSLALDLLRRYRWVRYKIFLRPDHESAGAMAFPDASRLAGYRLALDWDIGSLNRLLLRQIVNFSPEGAQVREALFPGLFRPAGRLGYIPTAALDVAAQERAIHAICGKHLGRDPRSGDTKDWIYTHLSDAFKRTTPRSLLLAFKTAAEYALERPPQEFPPLRREALYQGMISASQRRVKELIEDHPWLARVQGSLEGLAVPCDEAELLARLGPDADRIKDLEDIGVLSRRMNKKLGVAERRNVPDLYRLALGLKRKGGIPRPI